MNITKFGAFVNILPGRDGLVHISKLGGGKRIDRVEDVLSLGEEVEVRSRTSIRNGKISLNMADAPPTAARARSDRPERSDRDRGERRSDGDRERSRSDAGAVDTAVDPDRVEVSFEDAFDEQARATYGDLGPAAGQDGPRRDRNRRRSRR